MGSGAASGKDPDPASDPGPAADGGWLDEVAFDASGLIPAIAQDAVNGRILMFAWMNREALALTSQTGFVHYWSRSRGKLWRKGEESGHLQKVSEIRLDCDEDVILLMIEQVGGIACHTGRASCFYRRLHAGRWVEADPVLKPPGEIYGRRG
jgi:phosphoribosyl-AMP cyclohydrolase